MNAAVPRKWHTFPGKNKFFCDGRIVTSNQQSVFLLTLFLIIGVTVLFFVFDSPYLAEKLSLAIPIIDGVVFLFLMLFLFRTSWTDPGIIPRATPDEAIYNEKQIDRMILSDIYQPPRTMEVVIKGIPTKLKFCTTCKIFRPPRASHCSVCDNCVERFDHHCPWVGNCIGKRNYRYFYWFLVLVTINCCYILAFSVTTLVLRSIQSDFVDALKKSPGSIIEAVVCFIALWSVVGLTGFHTFLASCNITTNEDIKNLYSKSGQKNPFSRGSVTKNYCEIICGPLSPSLIDSRGIPVDQTTVLFPTNLTPQNPNSTSQLVTPSRPLPNSNYFFTPHKAPPAPALYQENARGMSLTRHNNNPTKLYPDVVTTQDVGSVSISQIGEEI